MGQVILSKWVKTVGQLVLLLVLIGVIAFMGYELYNSGKELKDAYKTATLKDADLKKERDERGREVTTFKAEIASLNLLKHSQDSLIQELKKDVGKWKNLYSYTLIELENTGNIKAEVRDSIVYKYLDKPIQAKVFNWQDDWMSMYGVVTDTADIKYKLKNSISLDYKWHRDRWYSRQYLQGHIIQNNPNAETTRVVTFVAKPEQKIYDKWWFQMGVGVVVGSVGAHYLTK